MDKELVIYQAENGAIELRGDIGKETIWANQKQISTIFWVDIRTINEHTQNIYKSSELKKEWTIRKFQIVQKEWSRNIKREINHYNLDMIISIWYRINSKTATNFRKWATQTLKQHITEWYTINPSRIEKNYETFIKAVEEVKQLNTNSQNLNIDDTLELIKAFATTWLSLDSFDKWEIPQDGYTQKTIDLEAKKLYKDIETFKKELIKKDEATELFAQEKNKGNLEGIFGNVFQSVFGVDAYPSIEEKAAHLLYFIIKNHPFTDGNKRTGAFSFIWFLQKVGFDFKDKITPEALTAITLLIANSDPKEKERIVGLVILLLKK